MCLLRFKNNLLTIEEVRFASILKKTPISKLSYAFASVAITTPEIPETAEPEMTDDWLFVGHRPGLELPDVLQGADQREGAGVEQDPGLAAQKKV